MQYRPSIIIQLDRPLPLTGVNPRSIMGKGQWNKIRKVLFSESRYHCVCCGVHKANAKIHCWLEAHEAYRCDYSIGKCELEEIQALCYCCHHFIHRRRLRRILEYGQITPGHYAAVIQHGVELCKNNGLKLLVEPANQAAWHEWHLIYDGKQYPPLFDSKAQMLAYQEWLASICAKGNDDNLKLFKSVWNQSAAC